jgi:hypothetical protein
MIKTMIKPWVKTMGFPSILRFLGERFTFFRSNCPAQCLEERLDLDWEEIPEEIQLKSEKDT